MADLQVGDRVQSRDDYRATVMYVGSVAGASPEDGWIGLQVTTTLSLAQLPAATGVCPGVWRGPVCLFAQPWLALLSVMMLP
jgi:hypothetical protein